MRNLAAYLADQQKRALDDRELTSRSDVRKARKEAESSFTDLARALCDCTDKQFKRLQLPEGLSNCVLEARRINSPAARDRALRLVRRQLRDGDAEEVRRQLDSLANAKPVNASPKVQSWRDRLIEGGEPVLTEFVNLHPDVDRKRLRTLIRNVAKASDANRPKALAALAQCVNAASQFSSVSEPDQAEPE